MPTASSVLIFAFTFVWFAAPGNGPEVMKPLAERKKNVGCSARKIFTQRSSASFGTRSVSLAHQHKLLGVQKGTSKGRRTDFIEHEHLLLAFRFALHERASE